MDKMSFAGDPYRVSIKPNHLRLQALGPRLKPRPPLAFEIGPKDFKLRVRTKFQFIIKFVTIFRTFNRN